MSKLRLSLLEDEELNEQVPVDGELSQEQVDSIEDENSEDVETGDFITSPELNELRDIILDVPEDIELLLLNDDIIVLGIVDDSVTYLYTLTDDAEDFTLTEMPLDIDEIKNNESIIKYTVDGPDSRHSKVVDLLMQKLNPEENTKGDDSNED